jgi:competence protein ComEA
LFALIGFVLMLNVAWAATDANSASKEELDKVKGIGAVIAERIVDERRKNGPFKDLDDLQKRVHGIGPTTIKKMAAEGLAVGAGGSTPAPAKTSTPSTVPSAKTTAAAPTGIPGTQAPPTSAPTSQDAKASKQSANKSSDNTAAAARAASHSGGKDTANGEGKSAKASKADKAAPDATGDKKGRKNKGKDAAKAETTAG